MLYIVCIHIYIYIYTPVSEARTSRPRVSGARAARALSVRRPLEIRCLKKYGLAFLVGATLTLRQIQGVFTNKAPTIRRRRICLLSNTTVTMFNSLHILCITIHAFVHIYIYIFIYLFINICMCIYIYIYVNV